MIAAMDPATPARRHFRKIVRQPEDQFDLAEAALCIAWEDQDRDEPAEARAHLDTLVATARQRLRHALEPVDVVTALNGYLFDELQFRGNTWDYNEPANSFLDQVLARRTGLPITLAVVYLEIGWRLHLPVAGLALPGHFLVQYIAPDEIIVIDPFDRGRRWSYADCRAQVERFYGSATASLIERLMEPPTKRAILSRILHNLKAVYLERNAYERALASVERILVLEPYDLQEIRDRGLLRARAGRLHAALLDLDLYFRRAPDARDIPQVRRQALAIATRLKAGN